MRRALARSAGALGIALAATTLPAQDAGWVMTLGNDTVQVESVRRTASRLDGTLVTRAPVPRVLRYRIDLDSTGRMRRFEQSDIHSAPGTLDPFRSTMHFDGDSIRRDAVARGAAVSHRVAAPGGAFPFGTIPIGSSFQVLELALAAARRPGSATPPTLGRFSANGLQAAPMRTAILHASEDSIEVDYFGQGRFGVRFDREGRLLRSDWRQTTYQVRVERAPSLDAEAIGERWRREAAEGRSVGAISPRDSVAERVGSATVRVTYGRPAQRGRIIWGGVVPWGRVWRLGADMATHLESSADLLVGASRLPAGRHTIWMRPDSLGAELIVSDLVNVFGTQYSAARDVARIPMTRRALATPVERLTIVIGDGRLQVQWGDAAYEVALREATAAP